MTSFNHKLKFDHLSELKLYISLELEIYSKPANKKGITQTVNMRDTFTHSTIAYFSVRSQRLSAIYFKNDRYNGA